jgi:hypothetical protein
MEIHEGPYDFEPTFEPPLKRFPHRARWAQVRSGEWYAFCRTVGPDADHWNQEHPWDPNHWTAPGLNLPDAWACRHGFRTTTPTRGARVCECRIAPPPSPPTKQEIRTAEQGLRRLVAELSRR